MTAGEETRRKRGRAREKKKKMITREKLVDTLTD